tara:strand:+ start:914 stop:1657 length:744 start_codon:yes stop_codon:yes gene_type:complete
MLKWIGQHIVDLIARFRSDVYLEDIADGTVVDDKFLGLDANNKIVKETVSSGSVTGNLSVSGDIELGHASDTTLTRISSGIVAIENEVVVTTRNDLLTSSGSLADTTATYMSRRTLTTAEMNDLHNTPIQVAPSGGANTVIIPVGGMIRVDRASNNTNNVTLDFHYEGLEPIAFGVDSLLHFRRFHFNVSTDAVYGLDTTSAVGVKHANSLTEDVNKAIEVSFTAAATTNCFTSIDIFLTYIKIRIA